MCLRASGTGNVYVYHIFYSCKQDGIKNKHAMFAEI